MVATTKERAGKKERKKRLMWFSICACCILEGQGGIFLSWVRYALGPDCYVALILFALLAFAYSHTYVYALGMVVVCCSGVDGRNLLNILSF